MKKNLIAVAALTLAMLQQSTTYAGHVHTRFLWPSNEIPVCFDRIAIDKIEGKFYTKEQWKKWAQEGAQRWKEHSSITFTGWDDCQEDSTGLRVAGVHFFRTDVNETKLGTELNGLKGGVQIASTFPGSNIKPLQIATIKGTVIAQSIYKFGAALGILPEVSRADGPNTFCPKPITYVGDLVLSLIHI